MPKVLKITSVHCLCSISKRIDILHADKHEIFYKLIVLFLIGLARHAQITRVNLQYLFVILRKKSGMKLLLQFVMNPMFSHHCPFLNPSAAWP